MNGQILKEKSIKINKRKDSNMKKKEKKYIPLILMNIL